MSENPYNIKQKTHKLHGILKGLLASSIDYEFRIIFSIKNIDGEDYIVLIDIGTHDEVY